MIETDRLKIRLPELSDRDSVLQFQIENKDHFAPFSPTVPKDFYSPEFWEEKIQQAIQEEQEDRSIRRYLFFKETGELIGMANFTDMIRGAFQSCHLGYQIAKKYEGKGLMSEALRALISYVFEERNLHRIEANHLPRNIRSGKLLEKFGFTRHCVAKDYLRIAGKWEDHVLNSLTNDHWRAPKDS